MAVAIRGNRTFDKAESPAVTGRNVISPAHENSQELAKYTTTKRCESKKCYTIIISMIDSVVNLQ